MTFDIHRLTALYTPLDEALIELDRRRKDPELQQKVADFFGSSMFAPMQESPKLVYGRHITTPDFEFDALWNMVKNVPIEVLLFESSTKFVVKNAEKLHCAKMYFSRRAQDVDDIKNVHCTKKHLLFDFNTWQGKNMHDIVTYSGEKLVDLHHRCLFAQYPGLQEKTVHGDFFDWFKTTRDMGMHHYVYFFSLFICNGILFDNNDLDDIEERKLVTHDMFPSFRYVEELFGVKPLIVPIVPQDYSHEEYWYWFDSDIMKLYGITD